MQEDTIVPARKRLPAANVEDAYSGAHKARIEVSSTYDRLDALDMLHGYMLMRAHKSFQGRVSAQNFLNLFILWFGLGETSKVMTIMIEAQPGTVAPFSRKAVPVK